MMKRLLILLALSATTLNLRAENAPWYQIEVLVFDYVQAPATGKERWPLLEQGVIDTLVQDAIQLAPPLAPGLDPELQPESRGFRTLNADEMKLHSRAQKLRNSQNYRVLLHSAWRQPVRGRESALAVLLDNMPEAATPANAGGASQTQTYQDIAANPPFTAESANPNAAARTQEPVTPRVRGLFSVGLARYLHVDLDLYYRNPDIQPETMDWSSDPGKPSADTYQLRETRRMRSKEMHFLDHPYFGVIVYIIPLTP